MATITKGIIKVKYSDLFDDISAESQALVVIVKNKMEKYFPLENPTIESLYSYLRKVIYFTIIEELKKEQKLLPETTCRTCLHRSGDRGKYSCSAQAGKAVKLTEQCPSYTPISIEVTKEPEDISTPEEIKKKCETIEKIKKSEEIHDCVKILNQRIAHGRTPAIQNRYLTQKLIFMDLANNVMGTKKTYRYKNTSDITWITHEAGKWGVAGNTVRAYITAISIYWTLCMRYIDFTCRILKRPSVETRPQNHSQHRQTVMLHQNYLICCNDTEKHQKIPIGERVAKMMDMSQKTTENTWHHIICRLLANAECCQGQRGGCTLKKDCQQVALTFFDDLLAKTASSEHNNAEKKPNFWNFSYKPQSILDFFKEQSPE
ncbi:hypothetical protein [Desulfocicer vacuolatum]|nr:hypothetical protein [Desulfocicer vacuolatum]